MVNSSDVFCLLFIFFEPRSLFSIVVVLILVLATLIKIFYFNLVIQLFNIAFGLWGGIYCCFFDNIIDKCANKKL